ncbi:protoporphyrinogen oxidase [Rhizoctonia solani]|uniref:Protoporphyrinogen oxidase n=1 Tax=Rhizoctonia solani TaxID=456999 RepID=A0A0K6G8L0_9AGAM|nr:protoporphyrinogen oxidase [Rhizoctonia solani]
MLELINLLNLEPSLVLIPYSHPAARNRFVHFPETGLTQLPSGFLSLLNSQFSNRQSLGTLLPSVLAEPFKPLNRPATLTDESFDEFISRRFGSEFARRFGSSLIHGIYAADSRKLSIRATFGQIWDAEDRGGGSVVKGILRGMNPSSHSGINYELGSLETTMKGISVYTFKGGMEMIVQSLQNSLRDDPRIEIRLGDCVRAVRPSEDQNITLETSAGKVTLSHLVSALPLSQISQAFPSTHRVPHLLSNPCSTVHVVNLVFPPSHTPIHPPGFGYLVPRPERGYDSSENPTLGCVFDSVTPSTHGPTVVTLMLGGPFPIQTTPLPLHTVLSLLAAHLGHKRLPEPITYRYHIQWNCIPTPLVGHLDRMSEVRRIVEQAWDGRLQVIGSGVGGVSVGDCVRDGRMAAINLTRKLHPTG